MNGERIDTTLRLAVFLQTHQNYPAVKSLISIYSSEMVRVECLTTQEHITEAPVRFDQLLNLEPNTRPAEASVSL